jgi:hypothetical protein
VGETAIAMAADAGPSVPAVGPSTIVHAPPSAAANAAAMIPIRMTVPSMRRRTSGRYLMRM